MYLFSDDKGRATHTIITVAELIQYEFFRLLLKKKN